MRTRLMGRLSLLFLTFAVALAIPAVALADIVTNNADATVDATVESRTIAAGASTTVGYQILNQNNNAGDPQNNCNTADATPATVTINTPADVTATPGSLRFTSCGVVQNASFTSQKAGTYTITATVVDSGAGSYSVQEATWSLTVTPPPDSTPPVINSTLNPANADGNNGWYKSNASLTWDVTDGQSTVTNKTGCDPITISSDTAGRTLTCEATSAGGTDSKSVTIKRDATAPTNVQFVGGPNAGGTYAFGNVPAEPTCTANDATSTVDSCVVTGYGNAVGNHTLTATATDKAGNKNIATRTYTVNKATAQVNLSDLTQTYNGNPRAATVATVPANLNVDVTYDGNAQAPTNAGSYAVVATVDNANYQGSASGTLKIEKAAATVNLSGLNHTYDGTVKAASASTIPSGLNVDLAYSQNGNVATPKNAGSYAVVATVDDANYRGSANGQLVIDKANQSITFGSLADKTFGDANFNVSATGGNSGNAVAFEADGNCSVSGNTVQITGAGSCAITASQAGNANYNAATDVSRSFAIAKAQASLNLSGLSKTYNGSPQGATVTTTPADLGGVNVTYDGSTTVPENAGRYTVVASLTNPNYEARDATGTLVIDKAQAQVSLSNLIQTYDGTVKAASASTTPSDLNVDLAYSQNDNVATPKNAGSYAVVATVDDANYRGSAEGTLVIKKAQATINLGGLSKTYNGSPQGATVTTTPDTPDAQLTVTYNGSEQAPTNAGSYNVVASLNDANYEARDATGTLVIDKAEATINLGGLSKTYTGQAQGATVTTTPAGLGGVSVTYDGSTTVPENAGRYTVVASLTNPNYEAPNATNTLVIAKATARVTLSDLSKTYTGQAQGATVGTTPAGLNVGVTYDGNAQVPINAGSYAVVATVNEANYEGSANGTLVIDKASQAITFAPLADKILGAADFNVSATGGKSGEAVTFAAAGSCTISGNALVRITGVGKCDITASQAGNGNYEAAPSVTRSFNTIYNWNGYRQPVDNGIFNSAKAGQSIPMKFSLSGNQGLGVIAANFPKVTQVTCPGAAATVDAIEEYAAVTTNNGLTYDASIDQYNYVWKTQSTYAGKCYQFNLVLTDGTSHTALFKFTK